MRGRQYGSLMICSRVSNSTDPPSALLWITPEPVTQCVWYGSTGLVARSKSCLRRWNYSRRDKLAFGKSFGSQQPLSEIAGRNAGQSHGTLCNAVDRVRRAVRRHSKLVSVNLEANLVVAP